MQQSDFDQLLVNLRMDAVFVKENMRIMWVSEAGMVENIDQIIKEYKDSRKLQVETHTYHIKFVTKTHVYFVCIC